MTRIWEKRWETKYYTSSYNICVLTNEFSTGVNVPHVYCMVELLVNTYNLQMRHLFCHHCM